MDAPPFTPHSAIGPQPASLARNGVAESGSEVSVPAYRRSIFQVAMTWIFWHVLALTQAPQFLAVYLRRSHIYNP